MGRKDLFAMSIHDSREVVDVGVSRRGEASEEIEGEARKLW